MTYVIQSRGRYQTESLSVFFKSFFILYSNLDYSKEKIATTSIFATLL